MTPTPPAPGLDGLDPNRPTVHIVGLSGGKDSSALAIHLSRSSELQGQRVEYFFCDTGAELPETYEYLAILEATFGKPIHRLNSGRDFDHWMDVYRGTLPSPTVRWCTRMMKIKPLEDWIDDNFADHNVISYVAIRADEPNREGYLSTKSNVFVRYPFRRGRHRQRRRHADPRRVRRRPAQILRMAHQVRLLLLLLPTQSRMGRPRRTPPRPVRTSPRRTKTKSARTTPATASKAPNSPGRKVNHYPN